MVTRETVLQRLPLVMLATSDQRFTQRLPLVVLATSDQRFTHRCHWDSSPAIASGGAGNE